MADFDFLIVGAGLYGSIFAHEATKRGKKCLVIDKRSHLGGNVYTEKVEGINVHKYGAHIFHTSNKKIWEYINSFAEFNRYTNSPLANYKGELYNLPFNMNTFKQMWNIKTPEEAKEIIHKQTRNLNISEPRNLEEQALTLVGTDIYEKFIKGYTEKQWGCRATELPSFIIKRIPIRFTYDNNYFNDQYQGIPIGGYTSIIEKMLSGITLKLNVEFFQNREYFMNLAKTVLYTGMIDEFYDYKFGTLKYRSLDFESTIMETNNFQGNAVVNYTDFETPYTRILEHKHFEFGEQDKTVVTKEYSKKWTKGIEPYYPVNDLENNNIYQLYHELAKKEDNIIFGGRLADYKYYDMHHIVALSLKKIQEVFKESETQ